MDKIRVADALRKHLERRLAAALECDPRDLRNTKLGTLVHLAFLVNGDMENMGGFSGTMRGILDLIGTELTWVQPVTESEEESVPGGKKEAEEVIN